MAQSQNEYQMSVRMNVLVLHMSTQINLNKHNNAELKKKQAAERHHDYFWEGKKENGINETLEFYTGNIS